PVVMAPLRREWADVQADCEKLWTDLQKAMREGSKQKGSKSPAKLRQAFEKRLTDFGHRLAEVKILDPACGSGNFLYVAINLLLDLEKQVIAFASTYNISLLPQVRPTQLLGIESTRSPRSWPKSSSGSATCNGCSKTVSSPPAIRSWSRSRTSRTWTRSST